MNQTKVMSLKAKLEVDLNSIKRIETELKKLSDSFKKFETDVRTNTAGLDKTIQQAFFGKRGTDRSTIKTFFKNEFKAITKSFTDEIKNASTQLIANASSTSNSTTETLAKIISAQQKKIDNLTKGSKKVVGGSKTTTKSPKVEITDDMRKIYEVVVSEQNLYKMLIRNNARFNKQWTAQLKRDFEARIAELSDGSNKELRAMGDYYRGIEKEQQKLERKLLRARSKVPQATFLPGEINKNIVGGGQSYQSDMAELRRHYTEESQKALKERILLNVNAAKISRQIDENEYKRKVKQEKAINKLKGEELYAQVQLEQKMYAEKKRLQEAQLNDAKGYLKNLWASGPFAQYLEQIKESPLKSLTTGIADGVKGIIGGLTSVYEKFKMLFKLIATGGALAVGSFLGIGAVVQKLASGVLFATEKMRGYQIALFGMMKTQDGVNKLMEKAFKVTKNLPISYEQVYQSTKAFTLIGPVRDMLKNVGETETVLKRMYSITMALSQIEPEWGLAGAQFSLREALSGDLRSLQRRFEIPVNLIYSKDGRSLRQLKNDPEAMSEALSDYFKEFYNEETLGMAANQFGAIISKIEGIWFNFQSAIGNAGFYDMFVGKLRDVRDELSEFTETLEFKDVTNRISNALGSSLNSILSTIEKLTVSFGKLMGINVESSNAFQLAADVIEKFAAVLRIVDRFVSETDVFGILNSSLQKTKQLVYDITSYGLKVFKTIARDVDILITGLEKLPNIFGFLTENTGRGLFYLWLFGPQNIMQTISGFSTAVIAAFVSIGSAIKSVIALNTVFSSMVGANVLSWGAAITGMVLGLEQIGGTFKFAISSVDDALESSTFYKIYAWLTGKTLASDIEKQLSVFSGNFKYLTPETKSSLSGALTKEMGFKDIGRAEFILNNPDRLFSVISESSEHLEKFNKALDIVENEMKTNVINGTVYKRELTTDQAFQIQNLRAISNYFKQHPDTFGELNKRYMREDTKLDMYQDDDFGRLNAARQNLQDFYNDLSKFTGNAIDTMSIMLKPAISDSEKALFAARRGDKIMKRGDDAIKNINEGAKIAGASLLSVFKMAGFDVGVTSGWRNDAKKDSLHNVAGQSYAIDYQPNIGGKLITGAADVKTPEFESLVAALQANENIAKVILEYKDKSIFGDKYKDISADMPTAKEGAVIHVEFKKDLEKTEAGMIGLLSSVASSSSELMRLQQLIKDEWNKQSPQLPNKEFLKQPYQRATEFIKNIYEPTMESLKDGYKSSVELIADTSKEFDELFKGEEGVPKFGPAKINKLKRQQSSLMSFWKDLQEQGVTESSLVQDIIGLKGLTTSIKPIDSLVGYRSMFDNMQARFSKEMSGYVEFLKDVPNKIKDIQKKIDIEESVAAEAWGFALEGKSYEFINIVGSNIKEFQNDLMAKIAEEAMAQAVYENLGQVSTSDISDFYTAMGSVIAQMKAANISFEEAIQNAELEGDGVKKLAKITQDHTKTLVDNNLEYKTRKQHIENNINALKKYTNILTLSNDKQKFMGDRESRSGYFSTYQKLIGEGQGTNLGDAFTSGLEASQNEFKNTFEIMFEAGQELNNNLMQTFDQGFFGLMTGEVANLGDMFRNVAKTIQQSIFKIISQMAAISATKLILGVDVQGGLTGGSQGGIGEIIGSLTGGQGGIGNFIGDLLYGKSQVTGVTGGDIASEIIDGIGTGGATSGIGQVLNLVSSGASAAGSLVTNVISGDIAAKTANSGGLLSKLGIGKITPLSALGLTAAATFLSQPGRLFGGRIDKTGAAQQALSDYNTQRQNYINRRFTDSENYYMGSTSAIRNYEFGTVGYNTWNSGGGFLGWKGPKEKHAAADPSAYLNSLKQYYSMLMRAGEQHYNNMKNIHKMAETNELGSVKEQYKFDKEKLRMLKESYSFYSSETYTGSDKYDKMDEYRDKVLEQRFSNWQMEEQIAKLEKETLYKQMEYDVFKLTSGTDSIAMAKVALEIEKDRHKQYTQGTIEWYDSKMALMNSESELAQTLRSVAKQTQENLNNVMKQIYEIGDAGNSSISRSTTDAMMGIYGKYAEKSAFESGEYTQAQLALRATLGYKPTGEYSPKKLVYSGTSSSGLTDYDPILEKYQKDNPNNRYTVETQRSLANNVQASTLRFGVPAWRDTFNIYEETALMEKQWNLSIDEIVENIDEEIQDYLENYALDIKKMEIRRDIGRSIYQLDTAVDYQYERLLERKEDLEQIDYINQSLIKQGEMPLMDSAELNITEKELEVAVAEFYASLGDQIANVINAGYIDEDSIGIRNFVTSIYGGLNDLSVKIYEEIMMTGRKMGLKSSMLGTIRDMEDFGIYNQVMATDEMAGLKSMMGSNLNMSGYQDPYSAWFDFNKSVIQTRIGNAEEGSEEWFAAQNDLFNLMIENAEKLKEKAENMNRSIEDMLGKIEETMRMRIAEERQTAKGDVYFVDVGSTRNSQQMLDRMLAAVKTNDPEAMKLIEEFKKKMLGIGR